MIYLDTRYCGFDLNKIGFPSVETCMAIVLETTDWLVGWHCPSCDVNAVRVASIAFKNYVQSMSAGHKATVRLYGVTHTSRGKVTVPSELRIIAAALGYQGRATYVLLDVARPDYVEFQRVGEGSRCKIYYKNSGDVNYTSINVQTAKTIHQMIKPLSQHSSPLYGGDDGIAPIVTSVVAKVGGLNLQEVKKSKQKNINVP